MIVPSMPESPRWLFMHNRTDQALAIIMKMHGTSNADDEEVQTELKLIDQAIKLEERNGASKWIHLFKNEKETQNLRRVLLGWWYVCHCLYILEACFYLANRMDTGSCSW